MSPQQPQHDILYTSPSGFNYTYLLPFEQHYLSNENRKDRLNWQEKHWHYVLYMSVAYIATIFGLKYIMKNRKPFELRILLIIWNLGLAVFSILGAARCVPEFIYIISQKGIDYSVCTETYSYGVTGYWAWLFIASKGFELLDTVFLILRKREVIFLHWYHHLTVLCYVWYSSVEFPAQSRWFATINYSIHAIMYTYYTIAALRIIRIPLAISMTITSLQIIQMVVGVYAALRAYQIKLVDDSCEVSYENVYLSWLMYGSYFYLFFKFFFDKYVGSQSGKRVEKKKVKKVE
jgi:elongation of very long chain fatty acids protein 6